MTADKSAVEALADEWESWWPDNHVGDVPRGYAKALRDAIAADRLAGRLRYPGHADIEALIVASSLGTPEAKAARESVPPEIGVAITLAAKYLVRAEQAERQRDEWKQSEQSWRASLSYFIANAEAEWADAYARGRDEALAEVEMRLSDDGIGGTTIVRELREQGSDRG